MKNFIAIICLSVFVFVGCESGKTGTAELEQKHTEENQTRLYKAQPPVSLDYSLERDQINKRTLLWNDENKVSYIYLISYGKVMAFYTIKGKVSSVNSQITNPHQLAAARRTIGGVDKYHIVEGVIASPAEDGSYGTNGDGVFFFTTDGTYVEWNDRYMLCDRPLKLSTPPLFIVDETPEKK